jgi:hypothetical protein
MDSDKEASKAQHDGDTLSAAEREALLSQWRKDRPDLSWKPLEGRELDRFLPFWNKVTAAVVAVILVVGVVVMLLQMSAPRQVNEVNAYVIVAGKPDSDGYTTVIVNIPGQPAEQVSYRGTAKFEQGQEVVLEEVTSSFTAWKRYRFKHPPESDS